MRWTGLEACFALRGWARLRTRLSQLCVFRAAELLFEKPPNSLAPSIGDRRRRGTGRRSQFRWPWSALPKAYTADTHSPPLSSALLQSIGSGQALQLGAVPGSGVRFLRDAMPAQRPTTLRAIPSDNR